MADCPTDQVSCNFETALWSFSETTGTGGEEGEGREAQKWSRSLSKYIFPSNRRKVARSRARPILIPGVRGRMSGFKDLLLPLPSNLPPFATSQNCPRCLMLEQGPRVLARWKRAESWRAESEGNAVGALAALRVMDRISLEASQLLVCLCSALRRGGESVFFSLVNK